MSLFFISISLTLPAVAEKLQAFTCLLALSRLAKKKKVSLDLNSLANDYDVAATKHKLAIKRTLTVSSTGNAGAGAVTRTHVQVLANSGIASLLILIHYILIFSDISAGRPVTFSLTGKNGWKDALVVGVMTYVAFQSFLKDDFD